ncbi:MAG: erythromycin biosynthesis sensory transduction protein eryC1 [Flavobacteriaceae bacterium]|nr:erythromycin biosynthesis sensory transduction protein eryC1 [Flavobacteriaceae bacterium]
MIPFGDPTASYKFHKQEINEAITRVLESDWYILGNEVKSFENEFASFHADNLHAIGVANGTDGIALSLQSLGLGIGDEIITTAHTAVATVAGIEQAGCTPVFADIEPIFRCIDPKAIESKIGPRTKAIMPVHIYGQPCEMIKILEIARVNDLNIVEDCSQAHGAEIEGKKVGTFGKLSVFSCYPTKNLGGIGDGGIILAKSKKDAELIKSLRQYGWNKKRESLITGTNSRLDEIQAAILRIKLKHLSHDNLKRRKIAEKYNQAFRGLPMGLPRMKKNELHAMHLYVIECENRDSLMDFLKENRIGTSLHYPLPVHQHLAYANRIRGLDDLNKTESFYKKNLTLPLYPELSPNSVEKVIECVTKWFQNKK